MATSRLRSLVLLAAFLVTAVVFHGAQREPEASKPLPPAAVTPRRPASPSPERYGAAAAALRKGNLQEARQLVADLAEEQRAETAGASLVEGLYAHVAGEEDLAYELLAAAGSADGMAGALEDWRLLLLGEEAVERGEPEAARAAFARLLAGHPASPLRAEAFVAAAELARRHQRDDEVLDLVELARGEELSAGAAVRLEELAWEIGRERNDPAVQLEAARRLFVDAPFTASALGVTAASTAFGSADRDRLLSPGEIKQRAYSFLDNGRLPAAAVITLDGLPEAERDVEWHLLKAQALTETRRPSAALDLLTGLATDRPALAARLEWERAVAAADLAERAGGARRAERRRLLDAARRHLERIADHPVALPAEAAPSIEALQDLYDDFMAAGLLDGATAALRLLRRVDPSDTTGASDLWKRGWSAYRRADRAGAVAAWRALAAIYPETNDAQRGRYWTARALEESGQRGPARGLYEEIVAASDTADFYGRQALVRLGGRPAELRRAALGGSTEPWPADPRLQRTKLLVDLGLDELAEREMELLDGDASARDLLALEALVLSHQGDRRRAIPMLRQAFPALGGPQQDAVPLEVLRAYYPLDYVDAICREAREHGLPEHLVAGIIRQESAFDPRATSPVGARGLMQLMPPTARDVARRLDMRYDPALLYEPEVSVRMGSAYFRQVLDRFGGNVELALAGYNGGPNRIRRMWSEAPPGTDLDEFVETLELDESRDYVKRILILADSYRQLYPELG